MELNCHADDFSIFDEESEAVDSPRQDPREHGCATRSPPNGNSVNFLPTNQNLTIHGACASIPPDDSDEFLDEDPHRFKNTIHTLYFNGKTCDKSLQESPLPLEPLNMLSPEFDFLEFDLEDQNLSDDDIKSDNSSEGRSPTPQLLENGTNRENGSAKNDLGSNSGFVRSCFVHSLSYQNVVLSPKYHNCLRPSAHSNFELKALDDLCNDNGEDFANLEACGQRLLRRESSLFSIPTEDMDYEEYNMQSALLCSFNSAKVCSEKKGNVAEGLTTLQNMEWTKASTCGKEVPLEKIMIWSEMEACRRQVTQIGTSACGATAAINVLMALNISYDKSNIEKYIHTRFRAETSPVAQYLISRSIAGTTHEDLIDGICNLTGGSVVGRFFHMYPVRDFHLLTWLGSWIAKGAVPIATLNLQRGIRVGLSIPDAWHHQMVFGVGPKGVYLTNPLECVSAIQMEQQLSSDSVLLVRRNDIVTRWDKECDLSPLIIEGPRWRERNVIGQVVNMLREANSSWVPGQRRHLTSHVKIPAAYKSGVTLFVRRGSSVFDELMSSPELPVDNCILQDKHS